jgi:hypothetical protein
MQTRTKIATYLLATVAVVAGLWIVNLRACTNISPGSALFPTIRESPNFFINVTLLKAGALRSPVASYWAATIKDPDCTYLGSAGGVPARVVYDFFYPLPFADVKGVSRGILAYDRFNPGHCWFQYRGTDYRTEMFFDVPLSPLSPSNNSGWLPIVSDDSSKLGESPEERVDLWCTVNGKSQYCGDLKVRTFGEHPMISKAQFDAAVAAGMKDPPALIHANTRTLIIQLHNLDAPDHDLGIRTE